MQLKYLYKNLRNASNGIDETNYSATVHQRYEKIKIYKELKKQRCSEEIIFIVVQVARSTFYRWKSAYEKEGLIGLEIGSKAPMHTPRKKYDLRLEQLVLKIRRENPVWGKKKIFIILKREYQVNTSISTVGRIITKFIKEGKVKPSCFYFGRLKEKRRREFKGHAQRWKYGMKSKTPGELIQIDHAVVEVEPGRYVKQFDATCPITKLTASQVYAMAKSSTAAKFLSYIEERFPYKIRSIQVDGGSEFMGDFEASCRAKNIQLYVLPPRSPEFNGNVERRHGTIKYEFFSTYDGSAKLEDIRPKLAEYMVKYNKYRPHESLGFETPWSFYLKLGA